MRTKSWCWTMAASSSAARTPRCWPPTATTPRCGGCSRNSATRWRRASRANSRLRILEAVAEDVRQRLVPADLHHGTGTRRRAQRLAGDAHDQPLGPAADEIAARQRGAEAVARLVQHADVGLPQHAIAVEVEPSEEHGAGVGILAGRGQHLVGGEAVAIEVGRDQCPAELVEGLVRVPRLLQGEEGV